MCIQVGMVGSLSEAKQDVVELRSGVGGGGRFKPISDNALMIALFRSCSRKGRTTFPKRKKNDSPTEHFKTLDSQYPSIGEFCAVLRCGTPDF